MHTRFPAAEVAATLTGRTAACVACLLPALTLSMRGSANRVLLVLLLLGLLMLPLSRLRAPQERFGALARQQWPMYLAMASLLIAAAISMAVWRAPGASVLDTPTRLAFFFLAFWAVMGAPLAWLRQLGLGCAAGALAACAMLTHELSQSDGHRPLQVGFTNLLAFSNIALLLGLFSMLAIGWCDMRRLRGRLEAALLAVASVAGIYASYASGSRGGWLALPLLGLVLLALYRCGHRRKAAAMLLLAAVLGSAYVMSPHIQRRAEQARVEVNDYAQGRNLDSSVGNRLQLWHAAWITFTEHPLVGVSRQNYASAMQALADRGVITPRAAAYGHSHNELMFNLATLGLLGLAATLAIWFVPMVIFARAACSRVTDRRVAGTMGLFLCVGFLIFGMTEVMFTVSMVAAFYTVMCASLLAIVLKAERQEALAG